MLFSWRKWCGLKPIKSWADLSGVMMNNSIHDYPKVYQSPKVRYLILFKLSRICLDIIYEGILTRINHTGYHLYIFRI